MPCVHAASTGGVCHNKERRSRCMQHTLMRHGRADVEAPERQGMHRSGGAADARPLRQLEVGCDVLPDWRRHGLHGCCHLHGGRLPSSRDEYPSPALSFMLTQQIRSPWLGLHCHPGSCSSPKESPFSPCEQRGGKSGHRWQVPLAGPQITGPLAGWMQHACSCGP